MTGPLSLFNSATGIDVGQNNRGMVYAMGLSDFFTFIFEDSDVINLMLEANSVKASDIYSNFLQLTSSLSLETIQTTLGFSLQLVFLSDSQATGVPGQYTIDQTITGANFITNRPFLPTETLENKVDFTIQQFDGYSTIQFAKLLADYPFSQRVDPVLGNQYAIWLVDSQVDTQLVYNMFGRLLNLPQQNSSDLFKNFVYGLFYLYMNGPTMAAMEAGANLVLGVPLARGNESVIDIRNYLDTDQVLVITSNNSYLLPQGVPTVVNIGDNLTVGQLLGQVVEISDYTQDGDWWSDVAIPSSVIPSLPTSQVNRFAAPGTFYYYLMQNYLARNTFLVRINVGAFETGNYFSELSSIINNAKPAQSQAVYVWTVNVGEEEATLTFSETSFTVTSIPSIMYQIDAQAINDAAIG